MSDATTAPKSPTAASQPPATRMWAVIQKLSRVRDEFGRAKSQSARQTLAGEISDLVTQLQTLADAITEGVREASD